MGLEEIMMGLAVSASMWACLGLMCHGAFIASRLPTILWSSWP